MRRKSHKASLFYRTVKKLEYNNVRWLLETTPNIDFEETVQNVSIMDLVKDHQPLRVMLENAKNKKLV